MNIYDLYSPFLNYFRSKRILKFYRYFNITSSTKLLDVGGNLFFWKLIKEKGLILPEITIVNLYPPSENEMSQFSNLNIANWLVSDGRFLSFEDASFDIVFSNSVIEHLGTFNSQKKFADEIRRVGRRYFVQTPNRNFFVEPHLISPFIHWLPLKLRRKLLRNFTIWGIITRPSERQVDNFINEVRLLTYSEMKELFPKAKIVFERFFLFNKSIIAIK